MKNAGMWWVVEGSEGVGPRPGGIGGKRASVGHGVRFAEVTSSVKQLEDKKADILRRKRGRKERGAGDGQTCRVIVK